MCGNLRRLMHLSRGYALRRGKGGRKSGEKGSGGDGINGIRDPGTIKVLQATIRRGGKNVAMWRGGMRRGIDITTVNKCSLQDLPRRSQRILYMHEASCRCGHTNFEFSLVAINLERDNGRPTPSKSRWTSRSDIQTPSQGS